MIVRSTYGNAPWTVFAEGVSVQTPLTIGQATIAIGLAVLALWMPLRVKPGLGTLMNVFLIGLAIDATLAVVPAPADVAVRVAMLLGGIATVGLGSGLYLGTQHGPGPRDGLMMGMHRATGLPIAPMRGLIEVSALMVGWLLGGTFGVGTLAFALLIGPAVQAGLAIDRGPGSTRRSPARHPESQPRLMTRTRLAPMLVPARMTRLPAVDADLCDRLILYGACGGRSCSRPDLAVLLVELLELLNGETGLPEN